jgi:hypothetical protein
MKHMASAEKKSKSNGSSIKKRSRVQYVVCIKNEDYPASLELRKLYPVLPDRPAEKAGMRRIIDESGEDYLYPHDYFIDIKLPSAVAKIVRLAS